MSPTDFFRFLGAPLANHRWSWGAIRPSDGALFLRVWQDETRKIDGRLHAQVTAHQWFKDDPGNLGYAERLRHIDLIRQGAPAYAVMCVAADTTASPRVIHTFDRNDLFVGGAIRHVDGEEWLELLGRKPVSELRQSGTPSTR